MDKDYLFAKFIQICDNGKCDITKGCFTYEEISTLSKLRNRGDLIFLFKNGYIYFNSDVITFKMCTRPSCQTDACPNLHICKHIFDDDVCRYGRKCRFSHEVHCPKNNRFLRNNYLRSCSIEDIKNIFNWDIKLPEKGGKNMYNLPRKLQICVEYQKKCCKYRSRCLKLHICLDFIADNDHYSCGLSHRIMKSPCKMVLNYFGFDTSKSSVALQEVRSYLGVHTKPRVLSSYVQTPISSATDAMRWYFIHRDGVYEEFGVRSFDPLLYDPCCDIVDSDFVERHYLRFMNCGNPRSIISYKVGKWRYSLDFSTLQQTNVHTKTVRKVCYKKVPVEDEVVSVCLQHCFKPGSCKKGVHCQDLHRELPYCWQYRTIGSTNHWKYFSREEELESRYSSDFRELFTKFSANLDGKRCDFNLHNLTAWSTDEEDCAPMYELRRIATLSASECNDEELLPFANQYQWYWLKNNVEWAIFAPETGISSEKLEETLLHQKSVEKSLDFVFHGKHYQIEKFQSNGAVMVNLDTLSVRRVLRRPVQYVSLDEIELRRQHVDMQQKPVPGKVLFPADWDKTLMRIPGSYHTVPVHPSSPEYNKVLKFIEPPSLRAGISEIERVQNGILWEAYCLRKRRMESSRGTSVVRERLLFHGTKKSSIDPICRDGFDPRISGSATGERFGQGSYFSSSAEISWRYSQDSKCLLLVRVLVGDYVEGNEGLRRPPARDASDPHGQLYDSTVDDVAYPTIFVTFQSDQNYPQYIIKFC